MVKIELSTVAFYRGGIPREIALRDCSLPMANAPVTAFSAFYGEKGKQSGFMAASQYAVAQGLQYTVIDMIVALDAQNPLVMKPDDLAKFDFLNFARMSTGMRALVSDWFAKVEVEGEEATTAKGRSSALAAIERKPALVDALTSNHACRHLKVIAYQAMTSLTDKPFTVGSIPHRHWASIRSADCRLNPNVRVLLDPPPVAT